MSQEVIEREPSEGADDPKRYSVRWLKETRKQALRENESLRSELANLRQEIHSMRDSISGMSRGSNGHAASRWEDVPEAELYRYATDAEIASEKPHVSMNALFHLFDKRLQSLEKNSESRYPEWEKRVLDKLQRKDMKQEVLDKIRRDFGTEVLDEDSEVFQVANEKYLAEQNRYGADAVNANPMNMYRVVKEAAEELARANGATPMMGVEQPKPQPVSRTTPQKAPPPREAMTTSSSEAASDRLAERSAAVQRGDTRSFFKTLSEEMFAT